MAVRKIVKIDEAKCNGCGDCIINCPEGALQIIDGKARLVKESYCDGLGACLGYCPEGAIVIEEREADEFDEQAVQQHMAEMSGQSTAQPVGGQGCPGSAVKQFPPKMAKCPGMQVREMEALAESEACSQNAPFQLSYWPIQLTLVPPNAPFMQDADLLLVADCVPFALADFHSRFLAGRPIVVGCPKLDDADAYVAKLKTVFEQSSIKSLTIIHMEVPCCKGLCRIAQAAMEARRSEIPVKEVVVSIDGRIVAERSW